MKYRVAIIGAYSVLAKEIVQVLSERKFPISQICLFDTLDSEQYIEYFNQKILIENISEDIFQKEEFDFVFFTGSSSTTEKYISLFSSLKTIVIDTTDYSKHMVERPCIVPEINNNMIKSSHIFSIPTIFTPQLTLSLKPIYDLSRIRSLVIFTYRSVSEEWEKQIHDYGQDTEEELQEVLHKILNHGFPQVDDCSFNSITHKESDLIHEIKTLLKDESIDIDLTCIRVPVVRGYSASVMLELENMISLEEIIKVWKKQGLFVYPDDCQNVCNLEGTTSIGVGKLRKDSTTPLGVHFWCVADNISRGRAFSSVYTAEQFL